MPDAALSALLPADLRAARAAALLTEASSDANHPRAHAARLELASHPVPWSAVLADAVLHAVDREIRRPKLTVLSQTVVEPAGRGMPATGGKDYAAELTRLANSLPQSWLPECLPLPRRSPCAVPSSPNSVDHQNHRLKEKTLTPTTVEAGTAEAGLLRPHAEQVYAEELAALAAGDDQPRPPSWRLSPRAVVTYLLGGELPGGTVIMPKYVGPRRLIEVAVATLATDRALLLLGVPGTAKTWVSEHLAAAVSGDSTLLVQGTSGTAEEAIRYGWNYARLLAEGPSRAALVPSPVLTAMAEGRIARVEELTRIPSDVQDALITILSEKSLPVPELGIEVQAVKGFSVIATANNSYRASTTCRRRCAAGSTPWCCRCPPARTRATSSPAGSRSSARGSSSRSAFRGRGDPAGRDGVPRTAFRGDGGPADPAEVTDGHAVPAEAISVVTSGIVLAATSATGCCGPPTRRGDHRRGGQGPGIDRVSGRSTWKPSSELAGLGGLLPRLPRGRALTAGNRIQLLGVGITGRVRALRGRRA